MTTRARWKECEEIAAALSTALGYVISKHDVFNYLHTDIIDNDLMEEILIGDLDAVATLQNLPGWKRFMQQENLQKSEKKDVVTTPAEKLKLALWFIARFKTPVEAMVAITVATKCISELSKE